MVCVVCSFVLFVCFGWSVRAQGRVLTASASPVFKLLFDTDRSEEHFGFFIGCGLMEAGSKRSKLCMLRSITTYRLSGELSNFLGILLEIYKLKGRKWFLCFILKRYQMLLVKNENECEERSNALDSFRNSESNASPVLLKRSECTGKKKKGIDSFHLFGTLKLLPCLQLRLVHWTSPLQVVKSYL